MFSRFKQKINIKYFIVGYVGFLLAFSSFYFQDFESLWKGILIVALYAGFDLIWTYLRDKLWYVPVSSLISGFILSIVALPKPPLALIIFLPLAAVASKQFLRLGKNRHVFNPASFGLAFAALFTPAISWWGLAVSSAPSRFSDIISRFADPSAVLFWIIALVGIFILWRQNRWHIAIPFIISYSVFLGVFSVVARGALPNNLINLLKPPFLDGTTIFFATVMLIEPITSAFPARRQRMLYGVVVGFAAALMIYLVPIFHWPSQDPLVFGLLVGNLAASLLFLPARNKNDNMHL